MRWDKNKKLDKPDWHKMNDTRFSRRQDHRTFQVCPSLNKMKLWDCSGLPKLSMSKIDINCSQTGILTEYFLIQHRNNFEYTVFVLKCWLKTFDVAVYSHFQWKHHLALKELKLVLILLNKFIELMKNINFGLGNK